MGGGITHPRLQHLVKWLWERVWDFLALGGLTSSVSGSGKNDRFSLLFGAIATPKERLWGRNPKPCCVHDSKHCEWVGAWHAQWL